MLLFDVCAQVVRHKPTPAPNRPALQHNGNGYPKPRRRWTEAEDQALQNGVDYFGEGKWIEICNHYPALAQRDNVSLKDRWRTLQSRADNAS